MELDVSAKVVEGFVGSILSGRFDNSVASADFHKECWELCCSKNKYVAIAAPRGHAKSTAITLGYGLATLLFRERKFMLLVSDTESQASLFLMSFIQELTENQALIELFGLKKNEKGLVQFQKESSTDFIVEFEDGHKFRVIAKGAEQKLRGLIWNGSRPDIIICDDMENDESVMNKERRKKTREWFTRALMPCISDHGIIRMVGTILHLDSLLEGFMPRTYAPNTRSTELKTWSEDKRTLWKAVKYRAHNPDFTKILWPEKKSASMFKALYYEATKNGMTDSYNQEYLNNPIDETTSYFRRNDFIPMNPEDKKLAKSYYITADLAISLEERADYSVFIVAGVDENKRIHVEQVIRERLDGQEIVTQLLALQRMYDPMAVGIEEMQVSKAIGPFLNEQMIATNTYLSLQKLKPGGKDKMTRAKSIQARMRAHGCKFNKEGDWYSVFEDELALFPRATHDDQVDAFAYLGLMLDNLIEAPTLKEQQEDEYWEELNDASMPMQGGQAGLGIDSNVAGGGVQQPPADPNAFINTPHLASPTDSPVAGPVDGPQQDEQLRGFLESVNIAEDLDEDKLMEIGSDAKRGFEDDLDTRFDWEENLSDWTKLAGQIREEKNFPWRGASNVKYPLLSTAAMQFAARAYPSLVPSTGDVVMGQVIGKDPTGQKLEKANRIGKYMSYQILYEMDSWEEEMDKMLIMLPVIGTMFKKTYWDSITKKNKSCLIGPKNLVVNYWANSLEDAERVSEIMYMSPRKFKEKQKAGVYLEDVELSTPSTVDLDSHSLIRDYGGPAGTDSTTPYEIIEQHTYLDLNDDGISEPYIITFDRQSGKVLRISARFDEKSFITGNDGKIVAITPIQYYTKFGFIPNPDGSFYDIGFGCLLGPLNESVNTLINQLIDAGTLSNLQGGFIGKGLRIKLGEQPFIPGEWKAVNATGDDLKKQIVPLPHPEPSAVLFQLMGALITSGKELASVADIFVGKMPGQNTPATTTIATIDQGMKVLLLFIKRIYRSLDSELRKLFRLNNVYLDYQTYSAVLDTQVDPTDFDGTGFDIMPAADPTASSGQEKIGKAEALLQLLPIGVLDPVKVIQRILDAQEQPNWQDLLSPQAGQPKPDPKMLELQAKQQADQQAGQLKAGLAQHDAALKQQSTQAQIANKAQETAVKIQGTAALNQAKLQGQIANDRAKVYGAMKMAEVKVDTAKKIARSKPSPAKKKT